MNANTVSICAVGDIIPDHDCPEMLFELALPALKQADIRFGQLEVAFARDSRGLQMHNPHARRVSPEKVSALVHAGFDVMSFAGNHALDMGIDAFLDDDQSHEGGECRCDTNEHERRGPAQLSANSN